MKKYTKKDIGKIIEIKNIDNYQQIKKVSFYLIPFWECDCSEFKRPQICTPNSCQHIKKILEKKRIKNG